VVEFNRKNSDTELKWFGQEFMEQAAARGRLDEPEYIKARGESLRLARDEGIDAVLKTHNLDALVSPAFPPAIMIDLVNGDAEIGGDATTAPAIAGYPILSVPMGLVHGLPVGLAVFGTAHSEPALLKVAASVEQDAGLLVDGGLQPAI
jgi:amidase